MSDRQYMDNVTVPDMLHGVLGRGAGAPRVVTAAYR